MKQLSIIVPIYNTEKYLRKCVDSLLEQDLDDYEILLINDSSPDSSIDIMKEYEERFPNIIRIFSKENGGLGDTRNFGIPYAKGKYVTFVDSDDYIKENSLNRLCTKMDNEDLDILVYDFVKEYDNVDFIHEQAMEIIDDKHYVLSTPNACNKMFKTSIFDENNKVIGYEEKLDQVEADSVIICVSQAPKNKLVLTTDQLKTTEKGLLLTDENCMTTHEGVFAAGDVVQGANTVVHAVEEAKRAAEGMIRYMERKENE